MATTTAATAAAAAAADAAAVGTAETHAQVQPAHAGKVTTQTVTDSRSYFSLLPFG
jgi:hypothetical protein